MKKTLIEELERIHSITYGKNVILEDNFLDKLFGGKKKEGTEKKIDDPKKADLVSDDVKSFFNTLKSAVDKGGISQQQKGSMTFQKEVESVQIGLILLGYELPKYGVDGFFGPETARAVEKFNSENTVKDKSKINEATLSSPVGNTSINSPFGPRWGRTHAGVDLKASSGTPIKSPLDGEVIDAAIRSNDCGGTIYISHADGIKTRYCHCKQVNVKKGDIIKKGDVVGLTGGGSGDVGRGRSDGAHLHFEVYKDGKVVNPVDYLGSEVGEFVAGGGNKTMTKATPEMLTKLIELLNQKGVKSEDLKKYIDDVRTGGGAEFTDLDLETDEGYRKYAAICQKFIDSRPPNLLSITGEMMASAAKSAYETYKRFVPAELALSQLALEGGIGNKDPNSRPIRTKNPFNVGNTDSGANKYYGDVQAGINRYYDLIAKNYLVGGKTAKDLITNFVNKNNNRYASGTDYEVKLSKLASQANSMAQGIV